MRSAGEEDIEKKKQDVYLGCMGKGLARQSVPEAWERLPEVCRVEFRRFFCRYMQLQWFPGSFPTLPPAGAQKSCRVGVPTPFTDAFAILYVSFWLCGMVLV